MIENYSKKDEENNKKESEEKTPQEKLEEDFGDIDSQLFVALTSRWRLPSETLVFGVSKRQLRNKTGLTLLELEEMLEEFGKKVRKIGLELISYLLDNETYYCLRSIYVVPNELSLDEQAILGTIIFLIERAADRRMREEKPITSTELYERLVKRGYYSEYSLTKTLRSLESAGYIKRGGNKIKYGARTKIEISPERRKEIADRTEGMLL